jgi:predicted transcriptional regulator of viral defense system
MHKWQLNMTINERITIERWVDRQLSLGKYTFTLNDAKIVFNDRSDNAIGLALNRLSEKGKILSIFKGFYLIIAPQYALRGVLPPSLFIDDLMKYLKRPYYVGLLSAASFWGGSHQRAQDYFIITNLPQMRDTRKKGIQIRYLSISHFPDCGLVIQKTDSGFLQVSNPGLTALDLIKMAKQVGGLQRVLDILIEMQDSLKEKYFDDCLLAFVSINYVQRLGFLLEKYCENSKLSDFLYEKISNNQKPLLRVGLKVSQPIKGYSSRNRWNIVENIDLERSE